MATIDQDMGAGGVPRDAKTSEYYRTDNIPDRFENPQVFQGYGTKPQHPMYTTEASRYGSKPPSVHTMPLCFHAKSQKFSEILHILYNLNIMCGHSKPHAPYNPNDTIGKQPNIEIDLSLTKFKKDKTSELVYQQKFLDLKETYCNFQEIYTGGSKHKEKIGPAIFCSSDPNKSCRVGLKDNTSVFNAELEGFLMALKTINSKTRKKFVIFTDYLSALQDMFNPVGANKGIQKIYQERKRLKNCRLRFVWIPRHTGIKGNERHLGKCGMPRNFSLNTSADKSFV